MTLVADGSPAQDLPQPVAPDREFRLALLPADGPDLKKMAALGGLGPDGFPAYDRLLADATAGPFLLARALELLAGPEVKGDKVQFRGPAARLLAHDHAIVRVEALRLLAVVGRPADAPPAVACLWDEAREVTYAAARTLAKVGDARAAVALDIWLKGKHREMDADLRRGVEKFRADLLDRLKKEEAGRKAPPPAKQ